jgi:hypothetical protein
MQTARGFLGNGFNQGFHIRVFGERSRLSGQQECELPAAACDLPHQMIFENRVAKMKLVEQSTLVTLQTARSWIDLAEIRVNTTARFAACLNRFLQQNRRFCCKSRPRPMDDRQHSV